tara:strand:- start:73 stop:1212 length:1140 start_codon:yes stop_codon:yes gene_type:complete
MGYGRALLQRDVRREERSLQKKAKKKSLWGSIGRTVGGLGVMALTGGTVNPVTLGLLTGGASFLGGAIGSKAAGGKLTGGKFFKSERESLQKELGAFGSQNITASLKSGVTAGIGQKLKLMKSGETAAKGLDFKGSFVGKGVEKAKLSRGLQQMGEGAIGTTKSIAGGVGQKAVPSEYLGPGGSNVISPRVRTPIATGDIAGRVTAGIKDVEPSMVMKGDAPAFGAFEDPGQYRRGMGEGVGGTGIDPNIRSTGNEFIDRQLGSYVEPKHRLSQAQSGVGRMDRGDMGSIWDKYNIEKVDPTEKMETGLFTKFKGGVRDIGRKFEQGLIEGEQYNQQIPLDVVPREQDISVGGSGGKNPYDWQLGSSKYKSSLSSLFRR